MLAARTAAEVFARNENATRIGGIVEGEIGYRVAGGIVAPVAEEIFAEPFARCPFQKAGGDNLVGVDIFYR